MKPSQKALSAYLVAATRDGNRVAADQLIRVHTPRLTAHATRLLGEAEEARDIVQDAWIEILRGLKGLRDDALFLPWALRIVTRRVARVIGGRQKDRAIGAQLVVLDETSVAADGPAAAEADMVRRVLATLPAPQRAAMALFYLEDMRVAEVAVALDVPVGTVKTRLMAARKTLRAALKGERNGKVG